MAITLRITKDRTLTISPPRPEQLPWLVRVALLALLALVIAVILVLVARMLLGRTFLPSSVTAELPKTTSVNTKLYTKIRDADEAKRRVPESTTLRDPFGIGETFEVR